MNHLASGSSTNTSDLAKKKKMYKLLQDLEKRLNCCENDLKDYENTLKPNPANPENHITDDWDNNKVEIFNLLEVMQDIQEGASMIEFQNQKLESFQQNLEQQLALLDKMVMLLKLEKDINIEKNEEQSEDT